MKIIKSIEEIQGTRSTITQTVGFVPTMGALHEGHISLIKKAKEENSIVIVSIFVNPTQFLQGEDLDKYPKKESSDIKICELCKVDYLFMPEISTIYERNELLIKAPTIKSYILEGYKRPNHFDGVLQVVLKLFNLIKPQNAYFGKKDAQQLYLITQMVKNLFLNINIIPCDIVRENDGLALSSRNVYLNDLERAEALKISKSLKKAAKQIGNGNTNCKELEILISDILKPLNIEYIAFVNRDFNKIDEIILGNSIILIAVKLDNTRLIDNIWI